MSIDIACSTLSGLLPFHPFPWVSPTAIHIASLRDVIPKQQRYFANDLLGSRVGSASLHPPAYDDIKVLNRQGGFRFAAPTLLLIRGVFEKARLGDLGSELLEFSYEGIRRVEQSLRSIDAAGFPGKPFTA